MATSLMKSLDRERLEDDKFEDEMDDDEDEVEDE